MDENKIIFNDVDWNTRLVTNPDFILREIGDECVVVPVVESGRFENTMLTLNETSAWLWRHFRKGATPAQVLENALHEFESENGDPKFIEYGVYRFLLESLDLGTLIREDGEK